MSSQKCILLKDCLEIWMRENSFDISIKDGFLLKCGKNHQGDWIGVEYKQRDDSIEIRKARRLIFGSSENKIPYDQKRNSHIFFDRTFTPTLPSILPR